MNATHVLLANAAATWFLTGLIWVIQVVHYPLFVHADRASYPAFADAHSRLITPIVGPAMLVELATACWLVIDRPAIVPAAWAWTGLMLVVAIWASTAALQVPMHGQLAQGFDAGAHAWLVRSNWIRTLAWTARSILVLFLLKRALQAAT